MTMPLGSSLSALMRSPRLFLLLLLMSLVLMRPLPAYQCKFNGCCSHCCISRRCSLLAAPQTVFSVNVLNNLFATQQRERSCLCALQLCGQKPPWTAGTETLWAIFWAVDPQAISFPTATARKWWPVFHWIFWLLLSDGTPRWLRFAL